MHGLMLPLLPLTLGSFWTYQDEAGDELARQQRVLTMPSTALVEWPHELDGETDAPCEWYNGTYVHEPSLCSHFAVQRLRAETLILLSSQTVIRSDAEAIRVRASTIASAASA